MVYAAVAYNHTVTTYVHIQMKAEDFWLKLLDSNRK